MGQRDTRDFRLKLISICPKQFFRLQFLLFMLSLPTVLSVWRGNPVMLSESAGRASLLLLIILSGEGLSPFCFHAVVVSLQETHKMEKNEACV